ncbi:MAG: magnesium transporter [Nanoarchaeota archaeon]|nr:magnesium transporter [Nanoarchaeota archaeon]
MVKIHKLKEFLEQNKTAKLKQIITKNQDQEVAMLIDQLDNKNKVKLYLLIPTKRASEVLWEVSQYSRKIILRSLKNKYIASVIEKTESDDSADILGEVSERAAKKIIEQLPEEKKEAIVPLTKYEEDTAGSLMKSELVSISDKVTVQKAIEALKKEDLVNINYVYIVDQTDKLKGVVTLNELITASPNQYVSSIMKKRLITLDANMDTGDVAEIFRREDIVALPVVDQQGRLLGRITVDDILDLVHEEATEDMFKFAGVNPNESAYDPLFDSIKKRLPWLILNLGTAFLAALTVSMFTDTLQAVVILAAFMPIVAGLGGNSGTQTLTLIVRGLALNQLSPASYRKIVLKEISVGIIHGMILGSIMGTIATIWQGNVMIGLTIFMAMTISITLAGFIATSVPMLLKKLKIDPAIASSVFITATTDIIGFFSFLGIATFFLQYLV